MTSKIVTPGKATRYLLAILIIFTLNFIIPRAMPGDPMTNLFGEDAVVSDSSMAELRSEMGLDKPLYLQYIDYWSRILHFNLGYSYHFHSNVSDLIISRMTWTLILVAPSIILGGVAGTVLGAIAGWRKGDMKNKLLTTMVLIIYSSPPYFLSILFLYLFSFKLGIFPLKGFYLSLSPWDVAYHMALPIFIMSLFSASRNYTIMRGSVIQEKHMLYVAYARAKGLFGDEILFRHIFKNALLPIITVLALDFGFILSGALFIEIVFSLNGMGNLIYDAILSRDYPVLQGAFLIITLMIVSANLAADILYGILDPRVRWQ
jgi:peptide/nickel transport system permease protein